MNAQPKVNPKLTDEGIIDLPGLSSRWVRLADGQRAHYVTSGDKGPAVILLHGGIEGSSGTAGWRWMAPFLGAHGFRVYCPDRPGFGLSDVSKPEYLDTTHKANIEFVKMFADALCLDKFHLSGNSAGCAVAANFVVTHPDRVLSVAFIAGTLGDITGDLPRIEPSLGKFTPNPKYQRSAWDGTGEGMMKLMSGIIYKTEAVWPEVIEMRVRAALAQREARTSRGLPAFVPFTLSTDPSIQQVYSMKDRLTRLAIPMIYMFGLLDVLVPVENGFRQEDLTPNIQFFFPDHTGHQGQTDRPEVFNQAFLEFFRDGKVAWPTAQAAGVSLRRPIDGRRVEEPKGGFPKPMPEAYSDIETLRKHVKAARLQTDLQPAE